VGDNIFQELSSLNELQDLDLSDNLLTKLPKDLSKFTKLKSIDLTNNQFKNVKIK
jgi:Leucine-rich repeat (LRR) protein